MGSETEVVTVGVAAARLGVTRETIRRMLRSERLRGAKVGTGGQSSRWRIYVESIDALGSK